MSLPVDEEFEVAEHLVETQLRTSEALSIMFANQSVISPDALRDLRVTLSNAQLALEHSVRLVERVCPLALIPVPAKEG